MPSPEKRTTTIVAYLNQRGDVGKTTLAIHTAAAFALAARDVVLVDADPQGSALDWLEVRQWRLEGAVPTEPLFSVIGLPRPVVHKQLPRIAAGCDLVVIPAFRMFSVDMYSPLNHRDREHPGAASAFWYASGVRLFWERKHADRKRNLGDLYRWVDAIRRPSGRYKSQTLPPLIDQCFEGLAAERLQSRILVHGDAFE